VPVPSHTSSVHRSPSDSHVTPSLTREHEPVPVVVLGMHIPPASHVYVVTVRVRSPVWSQVSEKPPQAPHRPYVVSGQSAPLAQPVHVSAPSSHADSPGHGSPACTVQPPPSHASAPLQNSSSSHGSVLGLESQPVSYASSKYRTACAYLPAEKAVSPASNRERASASSAAVCGSSATAPSGGVCAASPSCAMLLVLADYAGKHGDVRRDRGDHGARRPDPRRAVTGRWWYDRAVCAACIDESSPLS